MPEITLTLVSPFLFQHFYFPHIFTLLYFISFLFYTYLICCFLSPFLRFFFTFFFAFPILFSYFLLFTFFSSFFLFGNFYSNAFFKTHLSFLYYYIFPFYLPLLAVFISHNNFSKKSLQLKFLLYIYGSTWLVENNWSSLENGLNVKVSCT